jgi:isocitrate lyase
MSADIKSGKVSFDLKRFAGIKRDYSKEDVEKLKGTANMSDTLSKAQSKKRRNVTKA